MAALALALAACGGGGGSGPGAATPDAGPSPDAPASCNLLYLNFDGATMTPGAEDAAHDVSSMVNDPVTIPRFRDGNPDRDAMIDADVQQITALRGGYDVAITTERPASADYVMMLFGGRSGAGGIGGNAGAPGLGECGDRVANATIFVFDSPFENDAQQVNAAIGAYGWLMSVPYSDLAGDCMCTGQACTAITGSCTIGGPGTPRYTLGFGNCGAGDTMDEGAYFSESLSCP